MIFVLDIRLLSGIIVSMSLKRDRRITVPVTDEEREMLRTSAQSSGYSVQQFVRILISFAARDRDRLRAHIRALKAGKP